MFHTKVVAVSYHQAEFRVTRLVHLHDFVQLVGNWNKGKLFQVQYNFQRKEYHIN